VFVKRHQVDKEDGTPFNPTDLAVGQTVTVYGRTYILVDADAFTRGWYAEKLEQELAAPGDYPGDPVDDYRQRFGLSAAPGGLQGSCCILHVVGFSQSHYIVRNSCL
jgi:hypothetical protein